MKRGITIWLCAALVLAMMSFAAAEPLEMAEPLLGQLIYPQGADEASASYIFRLEFPRFTANTPADQAINVYYEQRYQEAQTQLPQDAAEVIAEPGAPANYQRITYQITANTDDYLSVTLTSQQFLGYVESEVLEGNVFARQGTYAGQRITLSQIMGLEEAAAEDSGAEATYASQLVWKLVWRIIQEQKASLQTDYFDDLTQADLERTLDPEKDFYLDMDGNLVFYVQAGILAGDVEGILTYPFAQAELLAGVLE